MIEVEPANRRGDERGERDDRFVTTVTRQCIERQGHRLGDRVDDRKTQFAIGTDRHLRDRSVAACVKHLARGRGDPVGARINPCKQKWVDLIDLQIGHRR